MSKTLPTRSQEPSWRMKLKLKLDEFLKGKQPPHDGIPIERVIRDFHKGYYTIVKAVLAGAGKLKAGWARRQFGGQQGAVDCILVSARGCRRLWGSPDQPADAHSAIADDLEPVTRLAEEFKVSRNTIVTWCSWKTHPILGRRIRSCCGTWSVTTAKKHRRQYSDSLMASRSDVKKCVEALHQRPTGARFGDNPGMWAYVQEPSGKNGSKNRSSRKPRYDGIKGTFKHDNGRLFFTQAALVEMYGWQRSYFTKRCYKSRLEALDVILPGVATQTQMLRKHRSGWRIRVYSQDSAATIEERRKGKLVGGCWERVQAVGNDEYVVWHDADGLWYALQHIANKLGVPDWRITNWLQYEARDRYPLRSKLVPRPQGQERFDKESRRKGDRDARVIHQDHVDPLFRLVEAGKTIAFSGGKPVVVEAAKTGSRGFGPTQITWEIGTKCYELMKEGKTRLTIIGLLNKDFTDPKYKKSLPKSESDVTTKARRRAQNKRFPLPWPISHR